MDYRKPMEDEFISIFCVVDDLFKVLKKLFDTKYVVVSKYIDYGIPQNISVGYAKGKLLNGPFFGSEILLHPKWSFLAEYAPINKDKLKGLRKEKIKWKYNFGLK